MGRYIKICTKCKNNCKQLANMGITMIKCPSYEPKEFNLSQAVKLATDSKVAGGAVQTKSK